MSTLGFIFDDLLSPSHILLILVGMLLIFGRRLPEVGRSLGQGIQEFKKGLKDVQSNVNNEPPQQQPPAYPPVMRTQNTGQGASYAPPQPPPQLQSPRQAPVGQGMGEARVSRNDMVD